MTQHQDHHAHQAHHAPTQHEPVAHETHDRHAGHSSEMFRDRFWLSMVFTIPAVLWSEHIQMLLRYRAPAVPGASWIPTVLSRWRLSFPGSSSWG